MVDQPEPVAPSHGRDVDCGGAVDRLQHVVHGLDRGQVDFSTCAASVGNADSPALDPLATVKIVERDVPLDVSAEAERKRALADGGGVAGKTRTQELLALDHSQRRELVGSLRGRAVDDDGQDACVAAGRRPAVVQVFLAEIVGHRPHGVEHGRQLVHGELLLL